MADPLSVASGVAGLVALAWEIGKLSHSYVSDAKAADRSRKQFQEEILALTSVLLHAELASKDAESHGLVAYRPAGLSEKVIADCHNQLVNLRSDLQKHSSKFLWPFRQKEMQKHIDALQRINNIFSSFLTSNVLTMTTAIHRQVEDLNQEKERESLLSWLHTPECVSPPLPCPHPGTGKWFLDSDTYQDWRDGPPSFLWCHGPPGVGKSLLASVLVRDLSETSQIGQTSITTYFFCDFSSREQQRADMILRTLLLQVAEHGDSTMVAALNKQRNNIGRTPDVRALSKAFSSTCLTRNTFLVFDAPDELENPKEVVLLMRSLVDAGCKVCITSRDIPEMEIMPSREDLTTYVKARLGESDFCDAFDGDKNNDVVDTIVLKADGIFLLVKLVLDQLLDLNTVRQIRKALTTIPTRVADAFQSSVARIEAQSQDRRELAFRLIRWITNSHRRLKAIEVMHAFAVEEDMDEVDEENCPPLARLLKVCVGLVTESTQDGTIGMVHTSAYEFFHAHFRQQAASAHLDMAKTSLLYLSTRGMAAGPCKTFDAMYKRTNELPFLPYAARYWGKHINSEDAELQLGDLIMKLLDDGSLRCSSFQALQYRHQLKDRGVAEAAFNAMPHNPLPLHLAAYWDLVNTTRALINRGDGVSAADSQDWTPLHWACSNNNTAVVKSLIAGGADMNLRDSQGWSPLFWTAFNGNVLMMQELLEKGAQHNIHDISGWTALKYAVSRQHRHVVEFLLQHNKESLYTVLQDGSSVFGITTKAQDDEVLLQIASGNFDFDGMWSLGHFDRTLHNIWRLLDKGERINGHEPYVTSGSHQGKRSSDDWESRMLHVAIRDSKLLVLQLLIELGADVNFTVLSQTPLHNAAFRQDHQFAELLLRNGADQTRDNSAGLTALQLAVLNGFEGTVLTLLKWKSDPNAKTSTSSYRKSYGPRDQWLLDRPRPARSKGKDVERTPLMLACGLASRNQLNGSLVSQIIGHLLAHDADVSLKDHEGKTCMLYAIHSRIPDAVEQLIGAGADVSAKDDHGMTAFHYAATIGNFEIIQMLIAAGADVTDVDDSGKNAFHYLARADLRDTRPDHLEAIVDAMAERYGPSAISSEWTAPPGSIWMRDGNMHYRNKVEYVFTPLSRALEQKNWELFDLLDARGARFHTTLPLDRLLRPAVYQLQLKAVQFLLDLGAACPPESWNMSNYFDFQKFSSDPKRFGPIVENFPSLQVDINGVGYGGMTMLQSAARATDSEDAIQALLDAGANPFMCSKYGLDAFLYAALAGNLKTLHNLFRYTAENPNNEHWTSHLCHPDETPDLARLCIALNRGGIMEKTYKEEWSQTLQTLLWRCAERNQTDMLLQLLTHGANTTAADNHGWTPLHIATFNGHDAAVKLLIQFGADVHAATTSWRDQRTKPSGLYAGNPWTGQALHLAAMRGAVGVVKRLLSQGVDVNASTGTKMEAFNSGHGPTALRIALHTLESYGLGGHALDDNRLRIAEMLVEHGAEVEDAVGHLCGEDAVRFKDYPDLWERIRLHTDRLPGKGGRSGLRDIG